MTPAREALCAVVIAAAACGCRSSPPKHFYVLDPVQPTQRVSIRPRAPVQIAAVNIPPSIDRQEMVRESTAGTLEISDVNRWGAALADMTQNVLTQDLIDRLPSGEVILPRTAAPSRTFELTIDILHFGTRAGGEVLLNGGWSLYRLGFDTPLMNHDVKLSEKSAADYGAQAQAMSRLIGHLADDIASSLTQGGDGSVP